MPLGTVVRDVYTVDLRRDIYKALDSLTRGTDWHRAGVYCFWDATTRQALYIGLTSDLPRRFAQHNGLRGSKSGSGNKGYEIDDWLRQHGRIGFSVILQEAIANEDDEAYSRMAEGQLIEGYKRFYNKFPPWNKMAGSKVGASHVRHNSAWWIDAMTGLRDSPVVARRTLRELSEDAAAEYFENCVHMARTALYQSGGGGDQQVRASIDDLIDWRAGSPLYDRETADRLRNYFSDPAPHPEI